MAHETEYRGYCLDVAWVKWQSPRWHAHCYVRIWRRADPGVVIKCEHRHTSPARAVICGKAYIRRGEARRDFGIDE
jgi:hypothetical protein